MAEPQRMNQEPYEAWFIRVRDVSESEDLMTAEEYRAFTEEG